MIFQIDKLNFSYTEEKILNDISFSIQNGEIMTILGPNGSGKSTLFNCIMRELTPERGSIKLNDQDVFNLDNNSFARLVGYIPQNYYSNYSFTIEEFVMMGRSPYISAFARPSTGDEEIVKAALKSMGIYDLKDRPFNEISGGQSQLVMVARVIAQDPKFILMDEPLSQLDFKNQIKSIRMIKELSQLGYGILLTTHNPDHATLLEGSVGLLNNSGTFIFGDMDEIIREEVLREIYGANLKVLYIDELERKTCTIGKI